MDEFLSTWIPGLEVIVVSDRQLSGRFFDKLVEVAQCGFFPGVIFGNTLDDVWLNVRQKSVAVAQEPPDSFPWVDIFPTLRFNELRSENRWIIGGESESVLRQSALKLGAKVLRITTHSDGVDLSLGGSQILCSLAKSNIEFNLNEEPLCISRDWCHRAKEPLVNFLSSENCISPESISAQVLILDSCKGVMAFPSLVSTRASLALRLTLSPNVAVMLATPDFGIGTGIEYDPLCLQIASGQVVGKAVAEYCRETQNRVFVFGDPRFACLTADLSRTPTIVTDGSPSESNDICNDLEFAIKLANAKCVSDLNEAIVRVNWIRWIERLIRASDKQDWRSVSRCCSGCNSPLRSLCLSFGRSTVRDRTVLFCPVCGPIADIPSSQIVPHFAIENSQFMELKSNGNTLAGTAVAALWGYSANDIQIVSWPKQNAELAVRFRRPAAFPNGLWRIGFIHTDNTWTMQSYPVRITTQGFMLPKYQDALHTN